MDLVGFRSCAHFFAVHLLSPRSPHPLQFRCTYHVAQFFLPCDCFLSLSLLVGCSPEFVFLLVVPLAFDTEDSLPML